MQKLIDFDHVKILINNYEGADLKLRMCMDGNTYMLKFGQKLEPDEKKPLQASYSSSPISEYLGCHVYEIAGIPVPVSYTHLDVYKRQAVNSLR